MQASTEDAAKGQYVSDCRGFPPPGPGALARRSQDPRPATLQSVLRKLPRLQRAGRVGIVRPPQPTAADLYGFASHPWLTEFLTVKGITSPKFFGNTKFKHGKMYGFLKETFADYEPGKAADHRGAFARGGTEIAEMPTGR